jgi:hypothetical protein
MELFIFDSPAGEMPQNADFFFEREAVFYRFYIPDRRTIGGTLIDRLRK